MALFILAWNIALISGVLPLILFFSIGLNQRLSAWLLIPSWSRLLTLYFFATRWPLYLFSTTVTLITALMNWLPVFYLQWLDHVPHGRHHLHTIIVWNSPVQELISSVMASSLLLPAFGTLSLLLYFWFPSTFLLSRGRSSTTLGTRWHDFFISPFINISSICFILFIAFHSLFLRDRDSRKGTFCPFCVPIHLKKFSKVTLLSEKYQEF